MTNHQNNRARELEAAADEVRAYFVLFDVAAGAAALLRAYAAIEDETVRQRFLALVESLAV